MSCDLSHPIISPQFINQSKTVLFLSPQVTVVRPSAVETNTIEKFEVDPSKVDKQSVEVWTEVVNRHFVNILNIHFPSCSKAR